MGGFFKTKKYMIQIFDKQLFGSDAEAFLSWDCAQKKQWIKDNTNQKNDALIDEFLLTVRNSDDECIGCKEKKKSTAPKSKKQPVKTEPEPDEAA